MKLLASFVVFVAGLGAGGYIVFAHPEVAQSIQRDVGALFEHAQSSAATPAPMITAIPMQPVLRRTPGADETPLFTPLATPATTLVRGLPWRADDASWAMSVLQEDAQLDIIGEANYPQQASFLAVSARHWQSC